MRPTPMTALDFRLLPTGQQYAAYAEAFRDRAELIEALRGQHAALSVTLAAVDAAATGATLTSTDGYASNIRTEARKQLQSVSALLSRLGAE